MPNFLQYLNLNNITEYVNVEAIEFFTAEGEIPASVTTRIWVRDNPELFLEADGLPSVVMCGTIITL